jgi:hypothetical protein
MSMERVGLVSHIEEYLEQVISLGRLPKDGSLPSEQLLARQPAASAPPRRTCTGWRMPALRCGGRHRWSSRGIGWSASLNCCAWQHSRRTGLGSSYSSNRWSAPSGEWPDGCCPTWIARPSVNGRCAHSMLSWRGMHRRCGESYQHGSRRAMSACSATSSQPARPAANPRPRMLRWSPSIQRPRKGTCRTRTRPTCLLVRQVRARRHRQRAPRSRLRLPVTVPLQAIRPSRRAGPRSAMKHREQTRGHPCHGPSPRHSAAPRTP